MFCQETGIDFQKNEQKKKEGKLPKGSIYTLFNQKNNTPSQPKQYLSK